MDMLESSAEEVSATIAQLGTKSTSAFAGLGPMLTGFLTSPVGIIAAATAATAGILALIDHFTTTRDEAFASAQETSQEFKNTQAELSSLDSQYQANKQRIEELRVLQSQGQITDSQALELAQLEAQTEAIKTQITALENLIDIKKRNANTSGEDYLNKTDKSLASLYDDDGSRYQDGYEADSHAKSVTDSEAIHDSIKKIDEFKKKRDDLLEKQENASTKGEADSYQDDIERFQSAIDALEEDMAGRALNLQDILSSMTDTSSEAFREGQEALDAYNTRSLDSEGWDDRLSAKIEFAYDLAQLEQDVNDAQGKLARASEEDKVQRQAEIRSVAVIKEETGICRKGTSSGRYLSLFYRDSLLIRAAKGSLLVCPATAPAL